MTEQPTGRSADANAEAGLCNDGLPCNEATEHLWEYVDGELSGQDCARIKKHVETCPPCGQLFHDERKVKDVVARACGCESAPQDLRGRVVAMVAQLRTEMCGKAAANAAAAKPATEPKLGAQD